METNNNAKIGHEILNNSLGKWMSQMNAKNK